MLLESQKWYWVYLRVSLLLTWRSMTGPNLSLLSGQLLIWLVAWPQKEVSWPLGEGAELRRRRHQFSNRSTVSWSLSRGAESVLLFGFAWRKRRRCLLRVVLGRGSAYSMLRYEGQKEHMCMYMYVYSIRLLERVMICDRCDIIQIVFSKLLKESVLRVWFSLLLDRLSRISLSYSDFLRRVLGSLSAVDYLAHWSQPPAFEIEISTPCRRTSITPCLHDHLVFTPSEYEQGA